jgi:pyruvate carboxylase subunit B
MARYTVLVNDTEYDIRIEYRSERYFATLNGKEIEVDWRGLGGSRSLMLADGDSHEVDVRDNGGDTDRLVFMSGTEIPLRIEDYNLAQLRKTAGQAAGGAADASLLAPMPGLILNVKVATGDKVAAGQPLVVIEAMKMENILKAKSAAVVKNVCVSGGQSVEKGEKLVEFE